jgi:hypothetical protein
LLFVHDEKGKKGLKRVPLRHLSGVAALYLFQSNRRAIAMQEPSVPPGATAVRRSHDPPRAAKACECRRTATLSPELYAHSRRRERSSELRFSDNRNTSSMGA